jgi:hypothetical protein
MSASPAVVANMSLEKPNLAKLLDSNYDVLDSADKGGHDATLPPLTGSISRNPTIRFLNLPLYLSSKGLGLLVQ